MKGLITLLLTTLGCSTAMARQDIDSEQAKKTLEIFTRIIEVETSKNLGNVPEVANYLAGELLKVGFPEADIEVVPLGETASLVAKYRGDGSSGKGPIKSFYDGLDHWSIILRELAGD